MNQLIEFVTHHPYLFGALGVAILAFIANEVHGNMVGGHRRLAVSDAVRLINDRDPLIVDLRSAGDFKKSHLLHAKSAPLATITDAMARMAKDKQRPVLLYCALGTTAGGAADRLQKEGYAEVYQLRGGIAAWLSANMPVTAQ